MGTIRADERASFRKLLSFDLTEMVPHVAPPYKPDSGIPVVDLEETDIDVAWIGSCTGGKLEDLAAAAAVLHGQKVAPSVRLIVSPATLSVMEKAGETGYLRTFLSAGA